MKKVLRLVAILFGAFLIVGCSKPKITKEQQDNVVKILSKNYDITSIEFQKFEKIYEAGSYRLSIRINESDEYSTVIIISSIEELNSIEGEWGLDPIENFEKIKRKEGLPLEKIDLNNIKINYI